MFKILFFILAIYMAKKIYQSYKVMKIFVDSAKKTASHQQNAGTGQYYQQQGQTSYSHSSAKHNQQNVVSAEYKVLRTEDLEENS